MCGIVALLSRRNPISAAVMQRATPSLYHRGPDGQRHWIAPDGRVALGHARLSIIDLTTGFSKIPPPPFVSTCRCTCRLLQLQQFLLALEAPAVASQLSILAHHAVARNLQRYGIGRACASHGARRSRPADGACHFAIGFGCAARNRLQVRPNLALKNSSLNVEGQGGVQFVPLQVL